MLQPTRHLPILLNWLFNGEKRRKGLFRGCPLNLAQCSFLHALPKREPEVPDPLTCNLPEFLSTLRLRAPTIRVLFDIFICKHRGTRPSSMIEIEHILDEEAIDG